MTKMEVSDLHQDAVLWETNGTQDNFGREELKAAVSIKCRWETGNKEVTDSAGNVIGIESTAIVSQVIPVGSILWKGKQVDLPTPVTNLRKVVTYAEIPDIKNRVARRVVGLIKHSDELPNLASNVTYR